MEGRVIKRVLGHWGCPPRFQWHGRLRAAEFQNRVIVPLRKPLNVRGMPAQPRRDLSGSAVSDPDPDDLGWRAAKYAEAMEVSVPRHQYAISLAGRVPDMLVASTTQPDQTNVQGTREDVLQQIA